MPDYLTVDELERDIGQDYAKLIEDEAGAADTTIADDAVDAAEGTVNSYLAPRYAVPVDVATHTEADKLLQKATFRLAQYELWESSRVKTVPDRVQKAYDQTIAWLKDVSTGKANIPAAAAVAESATEGTVAWSHGSARIAAPAEHKDGSSWTDSDMDDLGDL